MENYSPHTYGTRYNIHKGKPGDTRGQKDRELLGLWHTVNRLEKKVQNLEECATRRRRTVDERLESLSEAQTAIILLGLSKPVE